MAYQLHIERDSNPIQLAEWRAAVASIEGVRLCSHSHSITNPNTQEEISVPRKEGDAEVFFSNDGTWRGSFLWFRGKASFNAMSLPQSLEDPVWRVASALARRLSAVIRGDEGETYDLRTGEVVGR